MGRSVDTSGLKHSGQNFFDRSESWPAKVECVQCELKSCKSNEITKGDISYLFKIFSSLININMIDQYQNSAHMNVIEGIFWIRLEAINLVASKSPVMNWTKVKRAIIYRRRSGNRRDFKNAPKFLSQIWRKILNSKTI